MPLPPPKQRTAHGTYLYFAEPGTLETFIRDYRQILMAHFRRIEVEGGMEYWTCGQDHDPRIPGIGTGNPGSILSVYAVTRVSMILP